MDITPLKSKLAKQASELDKLKRELRIEAALERVRTRCMEMTDGEELGDVAALLFSQLSDPGFLPHPARIYFSIIDPDKHRCEVWMTRADGSVRPGRHYTPLDKYQGLIDYMKAFQAGKPLIVRDMSGDELSAYLAFVAGLPHAAEDMDYQRLLASPPERVVMTDATFTHGTVGVMTHKPLSTEARGLLMRVARTFQIVYTRLLDLQKAEAQAREAQIEAALERVRSRTMAMRRGDELADTAMLLFEQLMSLGFKPRACGFLIMDEESQTMEDWSANLDEHGKGSLITGKLAFDQHPILSQVVETWRRGDPYFIGGIEDPEELKSYYEEVTSHESPTENIKEKVLAVAISEWTNSFNFEYGMMYVLTPDRITDEEIKIMMRFAGVFKGTYRRFLDLQKAEAQAREAQIEAALERVRSRTMGMQRSDELQDAALLLFQQIQELGIPPFACGFNIWDNERKSATAWMGSVKGLQPPFKTDSSRDVYLPIYEAAQKGEPLFVIEQSGKDLEEHYEYLASIPTFRDVILPDFQKKGVSIPTFQIMHCAFFSQGYLMFITYEPVTEAHDIFKRFAKVFEQTYTRFLDLQKVEAQAREAQIELGLERVRARAMAMQHSDELSVLVDTLFQELTKLDFALTFCIINVINEADRSNTVWAASPETGKDPESYHMKFEDYKFHHEMWKAWKDRKTRWVYTLEGREKEIYDEYLYKETEFRRFPKKVQDANRALKRYVAGFTFSNFGGLQTVSEEPISNTNLDILARFGKVFDLTYTRFNDLKQAEIQAREATKQASLDRVRGEIASMRSAADLEIITPLIWRELTTLGIPFIRCGVFIVHAEEEQVEVYLSKPDGTSLAVMHLPFNSSELATQTVDAWQQGSVYKQYWTQKDFLNWGRSMLEQGQIPDMETYQGAEEAPESLHLHFIPFKQGMLYVGSTALLSDEEIDLAASLAKAFSIAYARYEDFVTLENAKAGIEEALAKLKATQSQLVQQEKLASLGQLTAGIAHEIKNPLNFVNNFSEVSIELVEELRDEVKAYSNTLLQNSDVEDISDLLDDLKSNLAKIHEHGSRADGIVKSMLMHSKGGSGKMEPTDLNELVKEYVNLAYHGMRAGKEPINVEIDLQLDESIGEIPLVAEDFARVILNLCDNAFDALRSLILYPGPSSLGSGVPAGQRDGNYHPKLCVRTKTVNNRILIEVEDNGPGIPDDIKDKILQPFFTTKKGTEGTGLGLSITYDIVKAHGGEIHVKSHAGESSVFSITLPRKI